MSSCAVCGKPAPIQTHYTLPEITRTQLGYRNLVACSLDCRELWHARRAERDAEVNAMQASPAAQKAFAKERANAR